MNKLTIRTRLLLGFALVVVIDIGIVTYFATILFGANTQVNGLFGIEYLQEADRDAYQSHLALATALTGIDGRGPDTLGQLREGVYSNLDQVKSRFDDFVPRVLIKDPAFLNNVAAFGALHADLKEKTDALYALVSNPEVEDTVALAYYRDTYRPSFNSLREMINTFTEATLAHAIEETENISRILDNINWFVGLGILGLALLTTALALVITVSISRQINSAIRELGASSTQISVASIQLSRASQEIANGAIEQASSIEETSSSIEELASMVKQNAANSVEASLLAEKTVEVSNLGYRQMEDMYTAIKTISAESDKIKRVIKVIDDIAFQTNMLALNAAVEAARAGEAGMGFAVVAEEVKNLANRSAGAAQETADLIESTIVKTREGFDMTEKMLAQFKDVQSNAQKLALMSREVETASRQQDIGIEQVNKAIIQFDEVVQGNASAAEETASAATELQTQVASLDELVGELSVIVLGQRGQARTADSKAVHRSRQPQSRRPRDKAEDETPAPRQEAAPTTEPPHRKLAEKMIPFEDDEDFTQL